MLTFFQHIIAGDSWGQVSLPISERAPLAWGFFILVLVSLELMVLNVILAAVVDSAQQARLENLDIVAQQKTAERKAYHKRLVNICQELDTDDTGTLTLEEISQGFRDHPEFLHLMEAMDIAADDISFVWGILDADGSGEVSYTEFAEELFKMKSKDSHTMIVFIKYSIAEMRSQLNEMYAMTAKPNGQAPDSPKKRLSQMMAEAQAQTPDAENGKCNGEPDCSMLQVSMEDNPPLETEETHESYLAASDFDSMLKPSSISWELQEALRKIEERFDSTNQLIRTISTETPKRQEYAYAPIPPQAIVMQKAQTSSASAWDICSVQRSSPEMLPMGYDSRLGGNLPPLPRAQPKAGQHLVFQPDNRSHTG